MQQDAPEVRSWAEWFALISKICSRFPESAESSATFLAHVLSEDDTECHFLSRLAGPQFFETDEEAMVASRDGFLSLVAQLDESAGSAGNPQRAARREAGEHACTAPYGSKTNCSTSSCIDPAV